ncbi:PIR protein [Plasmodium vivax]|uniref:VIR protein n=1 Tax=Plasmodium vivax TaxID=5855 RepID=A0A565A6C1_PLAVI|nr:PIR protein [Plasmodium vivax]
MDQSKGEEYYTYVNFLLKRKPMFNTTINITHKEMKQECKKACISFTNNNEKLEDYCQKIFNYLSKLHKLSTNVKSEGCHFLNYWMHNDVKELVSENILDFLSKILENTHKKGGFHANFCKEQIKEIDINVLKNVNDLITLYVNLYSSILNLDEYTDQKCTHLSECYKLYKTKVELCRGDTNEIFCNELENFIIAYNKIRHNEEPCTDIPNRLQHIRGSSAATNTLITFSVILVVPSVLFMTYKFTPFGTWIRRHILKKNKIKSNLNEKNIKIQHDSDDYQRKMICNQYNMQYQST